MHGEYRSSLCSMYIYWTIFKPDGSSTAKNSKFKETSFHVCAKLFNRCLFCNLTIDNNDTLFVDQSENERIKLENDELIILNFCKYYEFLLKILFRRNFIEYFKFYRV